MLKSKRQIWAKVFTNNNSFPPWDYLRRSVSPCISICGHLRSNRRFILPFTSERFIASEFTIVNTVDFQCWSNVRSPIRQEIVLKECNVQLHNNFESSVNQHRFSWFSTVNTTLEEIFSVLFTKKFSLARFPHAFHSTYRLHNASLIFGAFSQSIRVGENKMSAPLKIPIKS